MTKEKIMPALLLIGIPIAVIILFIGIMNLPDEEVKEKASEPEVKKTTKKKKK